MRLALFDLDNTLLAGDSDYEWGQFLVDRGVLEREAYEAQNRAFYEQYKAGTLDIHEFLGFALRPLADHTPQDLDRWHGEFMQSRIRPMIRPPARALVRRHLQEGDLCAIITATNSFVTRPIAREFGIEHLIATEPEMR
ncbi:MAG TPA: HAD-IB family phosphatase, partial [Burkholderiales bacterium]|nr:HAD-IB family phosphatase [Burkholderiales bacterium]